MIKSRHLHASTRNLLVLVGAISLSCWHKLQRVTSTGRIYNWRLYETLKLDAHFPIGSVVIVPFNCSVYVLCVLCTSGFNCPPSVCVCAFLVCALVFLTTLEIWRCSVKNLYLADNCRRLVSFAQRVSSQIIPSEFVRGGRRGEGHGQCCYLFWHFSLFFSCLIAFSVYSELNLKPNNNNILIFCSLEPAFKRCKRHHFI